MNDVISMKEQWAGFWQMYRICMKAHGIYGEGAIIQGLFGSDRFDWLRVAMNGDVRHPLADDRYLLNRSVKLRHIRWGLTRCPSSCEAFYRNKVRKVLKEERELKAVANLMLALKDRGYL